VRYLLLLWGDEDGEAALTDEERRAIVGEHRAFHDRLRTSGVLVLGEALTGRERVRTVRPPLVTDGPFAETKEQLGGFYVVDCETDDDALRLAASVPSSPGLAVEVRPIAS
jgi:hypothetical protein